jgi:ABC-type sugar transport system ATPase subunit
VWFQGRPVSLGSPTAATKLGIATVYQDLARRQPDVVENLFLAARSAACSASSPAADETKSDARTSPSNWR